MVKRITSNASKIAAKRAADAHGGFVSASKNGVRNGDITIVTVRQHTKVMKSKSGNWAVKRHNRTTTAVG